MLQVSHSCTVIVAATFGLLRQDLGLMVGPKFSLSFQIVEQLDAYVNAKSFKFNLPLEYDGTKHQLKVWHALSTIKAGEVRHYGEIARLCGSSPRAVGGACGHNPLPLFIPCHRVISATGQVGGFNRGHVAFNLQIKQWLLKHEGVILGNS